jgi:hypothetical protein
MPIGTFPNPSPRTSVQWRPGAEGGVGPSEGRRLAEDPNGRDIATASFLISWTFNRNLTFRNGLRDLLGPKRCRWCGGWMGKATLIQPLFTPVSL